MTVVVVEVRVVEARVVAVGAAIVAGVEEDVVVVVDEEAGITTRALRKGTTNLPTTRGRTNKGGQGMEFCVGVLVCSGLWIPA